jgi:hypothetical protein
MMGPDLWNMDFEDLRALYDLQTEKLHQALLQGTSWEETSELREKLASVHAVLYKKMNPDQFGNPAENKTREANG